MRKAERGRLQRARSNVLQAIRDGIAASLVKDELEAMILELAAGAEVAREGRLISGRLPKTVTDDRLEAKLRW